MHTINDLQDIFSHTLAEQKFQGYPSELYDPVTYTLSLGGKRLRPVMLLAGCDLFGGDIQQALSPAIGIELFHNFTLLHDDIMDQAPLRRGKTTVYKKWNTNIAILSGDTMFALAFQHLAMCDKDILPSVLGVFTQTAIEVCEGQQLDMNFETREDVSIADYLYMIRLKTAVLFAGSLKIGALIGGADSDDACHLYDFGIHMGIAFQLQDDLLDAFSNQDKFGKKTGGDIIAKKKTYLYLKAFELADGNVREQLLNSFSDLPLDDTEKIARVKECYSELNIKDLTLGEMKGYYAKAIEHLQAVRVPDNHKRILRSLLDDMMLRDF